MSNESENIYVVRHYFSKFVDITVTAANLEEALEKAEIPHLEWFDKNDTAFIESNAEKASE
jgi:CheY-like chemotaxis protein